MPFPLDQCDLSEPSVVVVRRYSNTPYIPRGMSLSLYLDMDTLLGDVTSTQFLLDRLCLHWLLPFSRTQVLLPCDVREEGLEIYLLSQREFGGGTRSFWSNLPVSPPLVPPTQLEEVPKLKEGQTVILPVPRQEGGSGYHPSFKPLKDNNRTRAQLECEFVQEAQELAEWYEHKWAKQAQTHTRWQAQMLDRKDATFQEVFLQASSMQTIKLLP